jgi:(2Fe-2S) ferredoxin
MTIFLFINKLILLPMKRFEKHIFVCENVRPPDDPKGCCSAKGSAEIRALLKKRIKELGLKTKVRANSSGCLDACEFGPSIVVYPEETWYGGVTINDVEEIIQEHILNDRPVKRLKIKHPNFNKDGVKV